MTTRLRPHHLLCMLTFAGEGYGAAFVQNFEGVVHRISSGNEIIEIVEGPDDVCAPLQTELDNHCNSARIALRDRYAAEALSDLLRQPIEAKTQLLLDQERLRTMREAFAAGSIRSACAGCQWAPLCDAISQDGFKGTRLLREEKIVTIPQGPL